MEVCQHEVFGTGPYPGPFLLGEIMEPISFAEKVTIVIGVFILLAGLLIQRLPV